MAKPANAKWRKIHLDDGSSYVGLLSKEDFFGNDFFRLWQPGGNPVHFPVESIFKVEVLTFEQSLVELDIRLPDADDEVESEDEGEDEDWESDDEDETEPLSGTPKPDQPLLPSGGASAAVDDDSFEAFIKANGYRDTASEGTPVDLSLYGGRVVEPSVK